MPKFDMEYNSQKDELVISEYGRNIQNIILLAKEIPEKEKRQAYIQEAVNLVNIMNPHNRNLADYQEKLWNHVFRIANYDLDVDVPNGIKIIKPPTEKAKFHLPYPKETFQFRHYGNYIQDMIKNALKMEEGEKRDAFAEVIASYMKLAYRTWNKEHYVNDEIIKHDLLKLSDGKLTFDDGYSIENLVSMKTATGASSNNMRKNKPSNFSKNKPSIGHNRNVRHSGGGGSNMGVNKKRGK